MAPSPHDEDFASALKTLGAFLDRAPLTDSIAALEAELDGATRDGVESALKAAGISPGLLGDAIAVRDRLGRVNDVIHATAIVLSLFDLLEPGEVLTRPSLAAGNDPTRPFDLESDRRVAEFKLAGWTGSDAMRKRQTFKDLVSLAADDSGRKAELFVRGEMPIRFLRTSKAPARWALDRAPAARKVFEERFGVLDMSVADFTNGPGAHVGLVDLEESQPQLFER